MTVSFLSNTGNYAQDIRRYMIIFFSFFTRDSLPVFTLDDVQRHKTDRWVIIDNSIYNLASMRNHSGGLEIIDELSGSDVTRIFHEVHLSSKRIKELLNKKYIIGKFDRTATNCNGESQYYLKSRLIDHSALVDRFQQSKIVSSHDDQSKVDFPSEDELKEQFKQHILSSKFPCLNAKITLKRNTFHFASYNILGTKETAEKLWHDLIRFITHQSTLWANNHMLTTFVACFRRPRDLLSEEIFEKLLWQQLQLLHEVDYEQGIQWAAGYTDDASDPHFGFSIGGRAFFIVGLHPNSSRRGRQFAWPALAFNSLDQFTNLRQINMITEIRNVIRQADICHNGNMNPNLIPNDDNSIAFEYSGKLIQPGWTPDFHSLHSPRMKAEKS